MLWTINEHYVVAGRPGDQRTDLLLERLADVEGRITKGTGPLTPTVQEEVFRVGVSPDALGAARRSADWRATLKAGVDRDRRSLGRNNVSTPVTSEEWPFPEGAADPKEVRVLGEYLKQYEAPPAGGPRAAGAWKVALVRV